MMANRRGREKETIWKRTRQGLRRPLPPAPCRVSKNKIKIENGKLIQSSINKDMSIYTNIATIPFDY
jgi:hypothetical protein